MNEKNLNLGDDCPIRQPTLEETWQWYLDDLHGHSLFQSDSIPDWFKAEHERRLKIGYPSCPEYYKDE